jgi:hypothetical protein
MKRTPVILSCVALSLLLARSVGAMSSPEYRIDWNNLLSGGGGPASSAEYRVDLTVGQTVSGFSSSPLHQVGLGYWAGIMATSSLYLPMIANNR